MKKKLLKDIEVIVVDPYGKDEGAISGPITLGELFEAYGMKLDKEEDVIFRLHTAVQKITAKQWSKARKIFQDRWPNWDKDTPATLEMRHAAEGAEDSLSRYETYDYLESDDPLIMDLLERLGYNPMTIKKGAIHFEAGQPLVVSIEEGYALQADQPTIGSEWRFNKHEGSNDGRLDSSGVSPQ